MTPVQQNKFDEFKAIREAVGKTPWLSFIFDETWFEALEKEMVNSSTTGVLTADPSGFFNRLCHPLRGAPWFEAVQKLFLAGRVNEIDADGRLALAMCGIDPVRIFIPLLDRRLKAFAELPFKQKEVKDKLELLRKRRSAKDFLNHFFEINVLGDLALKGILCDIEESATKVDGVIDLAGRQIFIEATNTTQEVIPRFTETNQDICGSDDGLQDADGTEHDEICEGTRVMAIDTDCQFEQVNKKLRKKVAEGKQLALVKKGSPTVLFLSRTYYGADRRLAEIEVNECFRSNEFPALSGVVLADSWKFLNTSWHPGVTPATPLTEAEERKLRSWYAKGNVAV